MAMRKYTNIMTIRTNSCEFLIAPNNSIFQAKYANFRQMHNYVFEGYCGCNIDDLYTDSHRKHHYISIAHETFVIIFFSKI